MDGSARAAVIPYEINDKRDFCGFLVAHVARHLKKNIILAYQAEMFLEQTKAVLRECQTLLDTHHSTLVPAPAAAALLIAAAGHLGYAAHPLLPIGSHSCSPSPAFPGSSVRPSALPHYNLR